MREFRRIDRMTPREIQDLPRAAWVALAPSTRSRALRRLAAATSCPDNRRWLQNRARAAEREENTEYGE